MYSVLLRIDNTDLCTVYTFSLSPVHLILIEIRQYVFPQRLDDSLKPLRFRLFNNVRKTSVNAHTVNSVFCSVVGIIAIVMNYLQALTNSTFEPEHMAI